MQAIFNRKESAIRSQPFTIDKIVELNEAQYKYFCDSPLDTYGFIDSFKDKSHFDENGVAKCILVLEEGKDDGILLVAEGYEYARYTSYLPCARQIAMLGQYPSLGKYAQKMATLADRYTAVALENQVNGETQFKESSVLENIDIDEEVGEPFNKHLFIEMMNERPEIQNLSWHYGGYVDSIGYKQVPEFLKEHTPLIPDEHLTGEKIKTPRGSFSLTDMTVEQMKEAGYGVHHTSDDRKYHIMGNGTRAFAVAAEPPEKENPLKHIEDTVEQNDNKFDGIINNTPQTPTVDELEQKVKAGEPISLVDLANAMKAEKAQGKEKSKTPARREEKPSIREQLKKAKETTAPKKAAKQKNHDLEV